MFQVRCTECGAEEKGAVTVSKSPKSEEYVQSDRTLSQNLETSFFCGDCTSSTVVETGIHPTSYTEKFETVREQDEGSLLLEIDGEPIEFESVDEKISKDTNYTPDGVRGTSHTQHVHVQVVNPPSLSKGRHRVDIGDFVNEEMILGAVRYHTPNRRTLKFYRRLDDRDGEPLTRSSAEASSRSMN